MKEILILACIAVGAAGIFVDSNPHFHLNGKITVKEGYLAKRQFDINNEIALRKCAELITDQECNSGLVREVAIQALRCGSVETAELIRHECATNAMGMRCGLAGLSADSVLSVASVCAENNGTSCTDDCRDLLMRIHDELGCCISGAFNSSTFPLSAREPFRYSLWSNCGVDTVDNCPDNSNIELPEVQVDPECSNLQVESARIACSGRFISSIFNALSADDDCSPLIQVIEEGCGVNEAGRPCFELSPSLNAGIISANFNCSDTNACPSACVTSLESLVETTGCCINNVFNGTLSQLTNATVSFLSDEFWSLCGLETPGICKSLFNGAPTLPLFSTFSMFCTVVITALLLHAM